MMEFRELILVVFMVRDIYLAEDIPIVPYVPIALKRKTTSIQQLRTGALAPFVYPSLQRLSHVPRRPPRSHHES